MAARRQQMRLLSCALLLICFLQAAAQDVVQAVQTPSIATETVVNPEAVDAAGAQAAAPYAAGADGTVQGRCELQSALVF